MQSVPVQSWNFEHESVIRIGRSTDNHVILYSAVVSRHHVEIRMADAGWEIVNLGANGTYLDGKRITQVPVQDGVIIRLARSGPNVQIHLDSHQVESSRPLVGEKTVGQSVKPSLETSSERQTDIPDLELDNAAIATQSPSAQSGEAALAAARPLSSPQTAVDLEPETPLVEGNNDIVLSACCQHYADSNQLFCLECGKPLKPIGRAGKYYLVKVLEQDEVSLAYLAWRESKTVVLKTLLPQWMNHPTAVQAFEQEARQLLTIAHPMLPKFVDVFVQQGQPFLAMEPVYGRSLDQIVTQDGSFTPSDAIARIIDVCTVLDYLHGQNPPILHQRLKPSHLIQRPTTLVLTGFTPGRVIAPLQATSEYVAPEQQQGHPVTASDLYALGPILVYLLNGTIPEAFYAQREQGFRFYAEYAPGLTADLVAIVRKLTNPQPTDRYTTAQEVIEALQQVSLPIC